jgi:hypothetical protein
MKLLIAIVLVCDMLAASVVWINAAQKSKCTNPFFSKGFTVFLDGKAYELGFRDDGAVVWKHPSE